VVVVYVALRGGPTVGLLTGTFAGLVQDSLASATGVIGIGGLAKTIVGYVVGLIGRQFIVAEPLPRFVVFFAATVVHELTFMGLYAVLGLRHFDAPYAAVAGQALAIRWSASLPFRWPSCCPARSSGGGSENPRSAVELRVLRRVCG
jgi:rod shape-determining protein MreD